MNDQWNGRFVRVAAFVCAGLLCSSFPAQSSQMATLKPGEQIIKEGEAAQFDLKSSTDVSTEFHGWCEVTAGGRATVMFDGEHYIPLSDPAVGDIVTLSPNETRRYDLNGTVEANRGDAYIAFVFTGVPAAMCFPGMQCEGTTGGAQSVKVVCDNS